MEQRSLQEVCDALKARVDEYYLQHPDAAKAHRSEKRRKELKRYFLLPMVHGHYCPSSCYRFHQFQNDPVTMLAQSQHHLRSTLIQGFRATRAISPKIFWGAAFSVLPGGGNFGVERLKPSAIQHAAKATANASIGTPMKAFPTSK